MNLLVTGATGKVGGHLLPAFFEDNRFAGSKVVALCHNRMVAPHANLAVVKGSLSDRDAVAAVMDGVTHVIHMAAVKESPDLVMDVAVKGMFHLLEAFRTSPTARQFILIGGDCSVGHIFHEYDAPITEKSHRRAYRGCYALTKIIEEVMLEQYQIQYGINGCCLRAPWIMEKDDFRFAMAFGEEQFGGPSWEDFLSPSQIAKLSRDRHVPLMLDHAGAPLRRNFVHVSDLVNAILSVIDNDTAKQQLFNISMNEPVDYAFAANYLAQTRGYEPIEIKTGFFSNWLDNSKARLKLGWRPSVNTEDLMDESWNFVRAESDPRKIWYPG